ncbi:LysE family translocator [uncultured Sphingomonas sp.]|uniref:LysE family translocator n=1 Tax=uncultured Sphingomonas sp. TaxID=158754 RepID=UPI0035C94804
MLTPDMLAALAAFALVSSITPGPNNLMLMASGTNFGLARSVPHLSGVSIGFVVMLIVVGAGLGAALEAWPAAMLALKLLSAAYLLYLAWKIATATPPSAGESDASSRPLTFMQAAAFQWVNPKAWTMALTAMAVYVPADDRMRGVLVVALVFGAVNLPAVGMWTAAGVQLRRLLHRPRALRVFNVAAALLLVLSLYPLLITDMPAS